MAIEYDEVRALKQTYEDLYRPRHEAFRALRKYFHGDYWKLADYEQSRPITSIFRDLTAHLSDIGPEIKLVFNVIQMVVNKYQTFLTPLPQIRMWVDPPESDTARARAMKKQRYLYGLWEAGNMARIFNNAAWYLPLMGDCYLGIHPNFDKSMGTPLLRSPEYAYPIPSFDKNHESAVIFAWKVHESIVAKNFVEYTAPVEALRTSRRGIFRRGQAPDPHVEIIEYSDDNEWHRWISQGITDPRSNEIPVGIQEVNGVEHNLGFNLFEHLKFIEVPDEPWGHGAVEQAINLNEMGNALYSLMFQAVIENVFPRLVLENPAAAPEEIESGPGAVIPLNAGGKAYWLQPEGPMIQGSAEFMRTNELNIRNATGMPGVNFGESPATSIVTGKAVNELQGAGTGSMIEMVQGVGIGTGIVSWNEKALIIGRQMFPDDSISLSGRHYANLTKAPGYFSLKVKGSELVGGTRNDVVFSPAMAQHERLVMMLQGQGAGLWSKKYSREQFGLPDSDAMSEEIFAEQVDDAVLGFILSSFQQQPDQAQAASVEDQAFAFLQGQTPKAHPLTQLGQPQIGPPQGGAGLPPAAGPPPAGGPPTQPAGQAPPAGPPNNTGVLGTGNAALGIDQVRAAFEAVRGVVGQVYLVGEIVQQGVTRGAIEVMITNPADQQALQQGLPQYRNRLQIQVVNGKPQEQSIDVTPKVRAAA